MNNNFKLPTLYRVLWRYPQLTAIQFNEICRRRVERAIQAMPADLDEYDARFAVGVLKTTVEDVYTPVDTRVFAQK